MAVCPLQACAGEAACLRPNHQRLKEAFPLVLQERTLRLDIAVLSAVPELKAVLPPTAIGKDYPYEGEWFGPTPSRTGIYASLGSYLGLTIGWVERS